MTPVEALVCTRCGRRYAPDEREYTCPDHEGVAGVLDVRYGDGDRDGNGNEERERDEDVDGDPHSIPAVTDGCVDDVWDFAPLLPVESDRGPGTGNGGGDGNGTGEGPVGLGAGGTSLLEAPALSDRLGVETLVKDETGNPTGSNKDRASAVLATRARERDYGVVTCASTGNAAASLAGYAARAGLDCRIFVPSDVPDAKAVQPRLYGAAVLAVDGSYGDAYELCRTVASERGWYNCNAGMNPYALEGMRTLGFELALGAPDADWVAMPMGNGCSLAAVWKGLREFDRFGHLDGTPRLLGVQAAGTAPIYERFVADAPDGGRERDAPTTTDGGRSPETDPDAETTADSIDVREPHNAERACRALRESGGDAVAVPDGAIVDAQALLGESEGLFVEPASAAAVAGVRAARRNGPIEADDRVVVVATGTGLKDVDAAAGSVGEPVGVGTDPADVPENH